MVLLVNALGNLGSDDLLLCSVSRGEQGYKIAPAVVEGFLTDDHGHGPRLHQEPGGAQDPELSAMMADTWLGFPLPSLPSLLIITVYDCDGRGRCSLFRVTGSSL